MVLPHALLATPVALVAGAPRRVDLVPVCRSTSDTAGPEHRPAEAQGCPRSAQLMHSSRASQPNLTVSDSVASTAAARETRGGHRKGTRKQLPKLRGQLLASITAVIKILS